MTYQHTIEAFLHTGQVLKEAYLKSNSKIVDAYLYNNWFTEESQRKVFEAWSNLLTEEKIYSWLNGYNIKEQAPPKTIALIMAGNIPLVGLHDLFCILISGHNALVKLSSDDKVLPTWIIDELIKYNPEFTQRITIADGLITKQKFDAVIATGNNNSNRYFEYYFKTYPHILRHSRTSIAVLTGFETQEDIRLLADDIFMYFGLGCRNVSKIYLPKGMPLDILFENFMSYAEFINHNKYANNYNYHKAIWLMNQDIFFDNNFILLKEDKGLHSPLATLFFEYYDDINVLKNELSKQNNAIQCIVSNVDFENSILFGKAQQPQWLDYADNIDTLHFLLNL